MILQFIFKWTILVANKLKLLQQLVTHSLSLSRHTACAFVTRGFQTLLVLTPLFRSTVAVGLVAGDCVMTRRNNNEL